MECNNGHPALVVCPLLQFAGFLWPDPSQPGVEQELCLLGRFCGGSEALPEVLGVDCVLLLGCLIHWKKSRISLRQIAIQYRAKFPVHFPAPVLEKLRTGIGQVQKSVQEITPYTFEGNVMSFRKCSGF